MEQYLDLNIKILKAKIAECAKHQKVFDLKKLLQYYTIDVLGELAFSQSFGVQLADDESLVPPVKEHSLLAAATGAWPLMTRTLRRWLPFVPHQGLQRLFEGRAACAAMASESVKRRIDALQDEKEQKSKFAERKDLLTSLILARHPDTGDRLSQKDLEAEAFGFMCAASLP